MNHIPTLFRIVYKARLPICILGGLYKGDIYIIFSLFYPYRTLEKSFRVPTANAIISHVLGTKESYVEVLVLFDSYIRVFSRAQNDHCCERYFKHGAVICYFYNRKVFSVTLVCKGAVWRHFKFV